MIDQGAVAIVVSSAITAFGAYWIATLRKKKTQPHEVIFDGYEKLLKSYQTGLADRDHKINELETTLGHVQQELDGALQVIEELKADTIRKAALIDTLEVQLKSLKINHQKHMKGTV